MIAMTRKTKANSVAALLAATATVLYRFPPEDYHFYPQCPVFRYLHVYCPGCGATRAFAALLHGRFTDALHYNALVVFLVPPMLYFVAKTYFGVLRDDEFSWPQFSPAALNILLLAGFLFAVFRNAAHIAL